MCKVHNVGLRYIKYNEGRALPTPTRLGKFFHHDEMYARKRPLPLCVCVLCAWNLHFLHMVNSEMTKSQTLMQRNFIFVQGLLHEIFYSVLHASATVGVVLLFRKFKVIFLLRHKGIDFREYVRTK